MTAHRAAVAYVPGRYPHRPTCSCGWVGGWGYAAGHAAQAVADDHASAQRGVIA